MKFCCGNPDDAAAAVAYSWEGGGGGGGLSCRFVDRER